MKMPWRILTTIPVRSLSLASLAAPVLCLQGHAAEKPARANLALELRFDGDCADTSESKRACAPHGAIEFVDGRQGQCASFDGKSWVDTGLVQQELGSEFTVECWVNPGEQQSPHADIFGNHVGEEVSELIFLEVTR